ncbi:unnamed protein product [Trifolium pratense]|uniref:Uncharacterized protein n=1 Tax=Trifolium pratense TaxID=57577 RepID=A0ACB0LMS3_TRIPR|nr:unnamed protein product [Trifolium pratense]
MNKIEKFVYNIIILLSLFLVSTSSQDIRCVLPKRKNIHCLRKGDCPYNFCPYPTNTKCINGFCHCSN